MALKVFHTGDVHIGMRFNRYETIKQDLIEARFQTLRRMVDMANAEGCNLFVVAGDLFDNVRVPKGDVRKAARILAEFSGECVAVLPGNHDYDDGQGELWPIFTDAAGDRACVLNSMRPMDLSAYGLDGVVLYPAPCDAKHSDQHRLGWIKQLTERPAAKWQIGVGHGALSGLSPDLDSRYFNMSEADLKFCNLDLWCLGHTHIAYPAGEQLTDSSIFNCGTPEPDGLDCRHQGSAWLMELGEDRSVIAKRVTTGSYQFADLQLTVQGHDDFEALTRQLLADNPQKKVVRLRLNGRLDEDIYRYRLDWSGQLRDQLAYLDVQDDDLRVRINRSLIDREFTLGSFPHGLLSALTESPDDDEALQLAYELVKGVKGC